MDGDLTDYQLQKKLQKTNKVYAKKINASLRGSTDEFVPFVIPAIEHGGRLFVSHPVGANEVDGAGFMDFVNKIKDIATIPFKIATMPLQMVKSAVMGSGEEERENGAGLFDMLKNEAKFVSKGVYDSGKRQGILQASASPAVVSDTPPAVFNNTQAGSGKCKKGCRKPRVKKGGANNYDSSLTQPKVANFQSYESVPAAASNKVKVPVEKKPVLKAYKVKDKKGGSLLSTLSDVANIMPSVFPTVLDSFVPPEVTRGIAKKIAEKAMGGAQKVKKINPWLEHVKHEQAKHPELKFKEVLKLAKNTYHSAK